MLSTLQQLQCFLSCMRICEDSVYGRNFNLRGVNHECGGPPLRNRLAEFSLCFRQQSRVLRLDDEDRSDDVATVGTDAKEELRQCVLCGLVGSIQRDQLLSVSEKQSSMPLRLVYQQQLVYRAAVCRRRRRPIQPQVIGTFCGPRCDFVADYFLVEQSVHVCTMSSVNHPSEVFATWIKAPIYRLWQ